jgi:hypothetical protein
MVTDPHRLFINYLGNLYELLLDLDDFDDNSQPVFLSNLYRIKFKNSENDVKSKK